MSESNLKLQSNIFPMDSVWPLDQNFIARIWDIRALEILSRRARQNELQLTPHQYDLLRNATPCRYTPEEKSWGANKDGRVICRCRKEACKYFSECRNGLKGLTAAQIDIWVDNSQDEEALERFDDLYQHYTPRISNSHHIHQVYTEDEPMEPVTASSNDVKPGPAARNPSQYPDDEEFES